MTTISRWGQPTAVLTLGLTLVLNPFGNWQAIASPVIDTPSTNTAQVQRSGNVQLAQIVGQCRAATRMIDIFTEPSVGPTSNVVRTLDTNQRVTLASEGSAGWIQVSAPVNGFVIARYLKTCGTTPPPKSCRRVLAPPDGLIVRDQPDANSARVGSVYVGNTLRVTGNTSVNTTGRTWVETTTPVDGWVSNGFGDGGNLSAPFSCP